VALKPLDAFRASSLYAPVRRWRLDRLTRTPGYLPDWKSLFGGHEASWQAARLAATGPRIVVATSIGMHSTATSIDSLVAVALTLRGARVEFLFCDGLLPACQLVEHTLVPSVKRTAREGPQADFCGVCTSSRERVTDPLGLTVHRFSDHIDTADKSAAEAFSQAHAPALHPEPGANALVDHALAGVLRFFGRAELTGTPEELQLYARYLHAAFLADRMAARLFATGVDAVVAHHGIYVPQGQITAAARRSGTRVVTWHPAYRKGRVIFQHRDTYHREMIEEPESAWGAHALSESEDTALEKYLRDRETGSQDWITFQRRAPEAASELVQSLALDPGKTVLLLAANVAWDARLHYPKSAYGHMIDWGLDTVAWAAGQEDCQLIVRCHPGEVMSCPKAQDRLDDAIRRAWPELPPNVRLITPEMETNTYALARISKAALIYNTKLGVELAARGMPVIVAGDSWIRGKGFSHDASGPEDYRALLTRATRLAPLSDSQKERARRYAWHFFFRRCIPVSALDARSGWPLTQLRADAFALAKPGADAGLDIVCRGILEGSAFEYDAPDEED
jgi:hypothetical protein